jgi:uncharacterized protein (DUF433 family)
MSSQITKYEHIVLDEQGTPLIAETNMKVVELVVESKAYGWSPDELYFQHPYLSLGQIHSALAYYWDHVEELNEDIERRLRDADRRRDEAAPPPLLTRLKARGLL